MNARVITVADRLTRVNQSLEIAAALTYAFERLIDAREENIPYTGVHKNDLVEATSRTIGAAREELFWIRKNTAPAALAAGAPTDDDL